MNGMSAKIRQLSVAMYCPVAVIYIVLNLSPLKDKGKEKFNKNMVLGDLPNKQL